MKKLDKHLYHPTNLNKANHRIIVKRCLQSFLVLVSHIVSQNGTFIPVFFFVYTNNLFFRQISVPLFGNVVCDEAEKNLRNQFNRMLHMENAIKSYQCCYNNIQQMVSFSTVYEVMKII